MAAHGKLQGKIALITGGTSGIGLESARLFRDEGATVIVTGLTQSSVDAASTLGVQAICSDVTNAQDLSSLMAGIKAGHGRLDVLFANAGIPGPRMPVGDVDEAVYDSVMAVNLKGLFFTVKHALPLMPDGSSIVLTASVAAHSGLPGSTVYAASKAGVRSLGRSFAAELLPRKIRVNTLTPGLIETPLLDKFDIPAEEIKAKMSTLIPMGRIGEPLEAAACALFLASSDSSFITGGEIIVSGGQLNL